VCGGVTHTIKIIHAIKIRSKCIKYNTTYPIFDGKKRQIASAINTKYSQTSLKQTYIDFKSKDS